MTRQQDTEGDGSARLTALEGLLDNLISNPFAPADAAFVIDLLETSLRQGDQPPPESVLRARATHAAPSR